MSKKGSNPPPPSGRTGWTTDGANPARTPQNVRPSPPPPPTTEKKWLTKHLRVIPNAWHFQC